MAATQELRMIENYIGGRAASGDGVRRGSVWNPATGEVQAEVLLAEPADVDRAVKAAKQAFGSWSEVSLAQRARVMFAFRELVHQHTDDLARIVSSEHGKV